MSRILSILLGVLVLTFIALVPAHAEAPEQPAEEALEIALDAEDETSMTPAESPETPDFLPLEQPAWQKKWNIEACAECAPFCCVYRGGQLFRCTGFECFD